MASTDRILKMVTERNHPTYPLTTSSVALNNLVIENAAEHNSRVTMRSRGAQTGYTGQVDLFYTRVSLSALGKLEYAQEAPYTLDSLLSVVNAEKSAQITSEDLTNGILPLIPNGVPTQVLLSAANSSLVWLGNVNVTILNGVPAIAPDFYNFWKNEAGPLFT